VTGLVAATTILLLFMAMFTEPGILPTVAYDEHHDAENENSSPRRVSRILLDGREFELSEFRAKISRYTANCIENFDHFCPWIGNAVGKRNYRYFFFFLTGSVFLSVSLSASCTAILVLKSRERGISIFLALEQEVPATTLGIYGYCMFFSLIGLYGFHLKVITTNTTTNEILKKAYPSRRANPHDKGCVPNCWTFLCAPIPRSRVAISNDVCTPLLA